MIWFTCKSCNKRVGRPESLSGTLVFCECGQGNRVPWTSTTAPPDNPPPETAPPPRRVPPPPAQRRPFPPPPPDDPRDAEILRPRRRNEFRRRRPGFCFNHDDLATETTCAACKEWFCPVCVVTLQGETLCGPCKNFRIRGLHRPLRTPALAVLALLVGLVSGPVTFCLSFPSLANGMQGSTVTAVALSIITLLLPVGGLVLSYFALREIETKPNLGGRGMAMTGATTSLVGAVWCLTVAFLVVFRSTVG
jgi:hypothetical protein